MYIPYANGLVKALESASANLSYSRLTNQFALTALAVVKSFFFNDGRGGSNSVSDSTELMLALFLDPRYVGSEKLFDEKTWKSVRTLLQEKMLQNSGRSLLACSAGCLFSCA